MKKLLKTLLGLALMLSARASLAATFWAPLTTDASMEYLGKLFGETPFTPGGTSPLGPIFQTLNTALLTVAAAIVTFGIFKGILGTAADGELLGKKMSSSWWPMKTALTAGALVPLPSGFSAVQLFCIWLITNGVGLADAAWGKYITSSLSPSSIVTATADQGSAEQLAKNLVLSYTCVNRINKSVAEAGGEFGSETASRRTVQTADGVSVQFGTDSDPTVCGTVTYSTKATSSDPIAAQVQTAVLAAQAPALQSMEAIIAPVGAALANEKAPSPNAIQQATAAYADAITQARQSALGGKEQAILSQYKQEAAQKGWFYAAEWYSKISELSAALSSAGGAPRFTAPATSRYMPGMTDTETAMTHAAGYIDKTSKAADGVADGDPKTDELSQKVQGIWNKKATALLQKLGGVFSGNGDADPIGSIKTVGDYLTDFGVMAPISIAGIVFGVVLAGTGATLTAGGPAFLAAMQVVSPILQYLTIPTLAVGTVFGVWVPVLPYVVFTFGSIAFLILCVEAVAFISIWTLAHVADHDEGLGGEAGFLHLLAIILRPLMMIIGLIASMLLFRIAVDFLGKTYFKTILGLNQSTFIGGVYFIAYLVVFCLLVLALQLLTLSPIWKLPAAATTWLGGHASDTAEAHSTQNAAVIASGTLSKNTRGIADGAKSAGDAARRGDEKGAPGGGPGGPQGGEEKRGGSPMPQPKGAGPDAPQAGGRRSTDTPTSEPKKGPRGG